MATFTDEMLDALSDFEIIEKAENLAKECSDLYAEHKVTEAVALYADIDALVAKYTARAKSKCFVALKESADPMLEAVKMLEFSTIKRKETSDKLDKRVKMVTIENTMKSIDLAELHKYCDGIGKDEKWIYAVEKFSLLMTARVILELSGEGDSAKTRAAAQLKKLNDSNAMSKIASEITFGDDNIVSNTKLLEALTQIVTMMIGEDYKPLSHDVKFLKFTYTKKGHEALKVNCADSRHLMRLIAEICNRIVTGGVYDVEYKVKRKS